MGIALSGCRVPDDAAQFGTVVGRIVDAQSRTPVNVGTVRVGDALVLNLSTSDHGGFVMQNVPGGTQTLVVNVPGYDVYQQQIDVRAGQVTPAGDHGVIALRSSTIHPLPTPVPTAGAPGAPPTPPPPL